MQHWCHAAAFGGETEKNAGTEICCWEYLEILGAMQDGRVEVGPQPRSAGQNRSDGES